jgi:hypothetical protein
MKKLTNGTKKNGTAITAVAVIPKPVVVPDGAPSISDSLPDVLALGRCTFADAGAEQLACVVDAFGMSRALDRRLEIVSDEDLRGHRAYRFRSPRAALVRSAGAMHVTLVAEALQFEGQVRDRHIEPIAQFYFDQPGCLPKPPCRPTYELTDEARARVRQAWNDATEDEAAGLYRPTNIDRFRAISAERIEVAAVMYRMPSGNGVLWIRHRDLIWPVSLVRRQAMRRVEPEPMTEADKLEAWRERQNATAY